MNKERRKAISDLVAKLSEFRDGISELKDSTETLQNEEQDYKDAMPESFQNGEKGDKAQAAIDALEEACNQFDEIIAGLDEVENRLNEAGE